MGGRNPNTSKMIEAVAEFAGIAVFEPTPVSNISREGSCFMGFSPDDHVPSADVGLLARCNRRPHPATASGESCRRRGHGLVSLTDP
jgi:hypothetical protein